MLSQEYHSSIKVTRTPTLQHQHSNTNTPTPTLKHRYAKSHDVDDFTEFHETAQKRSLYQSEKMLVLFFSAGWGNACNRINHSVAELAAANPGVVFMTLKADAEELKDILNMYNVKELPCFLFLRLKPKSEEEEEEEVKVDDENEERKSKQMCLDLLRC